MADDWVDITAEDLDRWAGGAGDGVDVYGIRLLLDLAGREPGLSGPADLTPERLRRLMLQTFPEEVVAEAADVPSIVDTARSMVDFLAGTGRLAPGAAGALHEELTALQPRLAEVIAQIDEAERETAGEVVRGMMLADGVRLDDEQAVQAWLGDFERLSEEERIDRATAYLREAEEMTVPAVPLAPLPELAAAARASGLLHRVRALAGWAGGRAVTEHGEPVPGDLPGAAEAAGLPGPAAGPADLADLPDLERLWWAAVEAGALTVEGGRAAPGPLLDDLRDGDDEAVLAAWLRLFDEAVVGGAGAVADGDTARLVRAELTGVLIHLYEQEEPADRDGLAAALAGHLLDTRMDHGHAPAPAEVADLLGRELDELESWGVVEPAAGGLELAPLGVWGVRELLRSEGFVAPVVGELADRPAAELVAGLAWHRERTAGQEIAGWLAARPAEQAAADLIEVMRTGGPGARSVAADVLGEVGPDAAAAVRAALDDPATGPYARLWLHEHGDAEAEPRHSDLAWMLADTVAAMLESADPADAVAAALADLPDGAGLDLLIEGMGGLGHPQAGAVLDALAAHVPDPQLAAAARAARAG
ncbi:hypothetical protein [Thermomonospora cellulosilytica]|uniref:Uncharacterized protein n=1 Tax=Thermomonospora cellulosilytica TaxID=1411118 RepID=A0A7W3N2X6_9ACTN|nr:hypothetical protein [Thermomonospora cellulosilytica]MBA9006596.1 hypothetical protein [Thermomonospora cellulosilytica]